jgi:hypothetical protein
MIAKRKPISFQNYQKVVYRRLTCKPALLDLVIRTFTSAPDFAFPPLPPVACVDMIRRFGESNEDE